MKTYVAWMCLFLFLMGCKSAHVVTYNKRVKEAFIYDFKITYFKKKLLIQGYNNSDAATSLIRGDQSGFGEIILSLDDYHLLDSIVKVDNDFMVKDSLDGNRRAEGTQGKRVLGYALNKYESKWLDSLAKVRARIFIKDFKAH